MKSAATKLGRRRSRWFLAAVAGAVGLLLAACGSGGDAGGGGAQSAVGAPVQELYAAAQAAGEDKVVVYGIKGNACYDRFSQRFPGITVESQYMVGETQARLEQEHVSGQNVGDVLRTGSTTMLALTKSGILTPFTPADVDGIPAEAWGPDHGFVVDSKRVAGIAYNTAQISPDEAPKSWTDLADPRFKGKIVMPDPTGPGAGLSILQELLQTGGATDDAWLERYAANEPALIQGVQPAIEALRSGEYAVMMGGLDQMTGPPLAEGSSLKWVFPVAGASPVTGHFIGIITNAPHPNAARLLESWLLSEEGQTCLSQEGNEYPVRDGVPGPPGFPALDELDAVTPPRPVDYTELDRQQKYLEQFQTVFGRSR
jgi:iron(III) transport system substrate-binding protein